MPAVSATIRSRTRSSRPPGISDASSARASSSPSPSTTSSGSPPSPCASHGSRTANTTASPSAPQSACHEGECLCRGAVEPVCIVDEAEQRSLLGHFGQESQGCETDEESIRRFTRAQSESSGERVALGARQMREAIQHRQAELMQAGERKLHLGLDARCLRDATFRRRARRGTRATRSCRRPPRRAGRGLGSGLRGRRRSSDRGPRTRSADPSAVTRGRGSSTPPAKATVAVLGLATAARGGGTITRPPSTPAPTVSSLSGPARRHRKRRSPLNIERLADRRYRVRKQVETFVANLEIRRAMGELALYEQRKRPLRDLSREWWAKYAVPNLGRMDAGWLQADAREAHRAKTRFDAGA